VRRQRLMLLSLNLSAAVLESDQHLEELFALIDEQPLPKGWQQHQGFHWSQGYLVAKPMPLQDTLNVLLTHQSQAVRL